jgi:hypothetical protein
MYVLVSCINLQEVFEMFISYDMRLTICEVEVVDHISVWIFYRYIFGKRILDTHNYPAKVSLKLRG